MKKKAPVQLTGGAGFRYENPVAARFLLDLLAGTNELGSDFGRVIRVEWQARESGWYADDLVIACNHSAIARTVGVSIKSAEQVTSSGFPQDFVKLAWAQWLGYKTERKLSGTNDAIALITGSLKHNVWDAWSNFFFEASQTTPERMIARLSPSDADGGAQSSALQRALFESFNCPAELQSDRTTNDRAAIELLCSVRLLQLDFEATPSRDYARALTGCQGVLTSGEADEAVRLWNRLTGIADEKRAAGGSIDLGKLLAELHGEFDFRDHPDYRRDWEVLQALSKDLLADVRTQISNLPPLGRAHERSTIQNSLNQTRSCLLVGESGCGKSALAKEIGQANYGRVVWFAEGIIDHETTAQFESSIGLQRPLVEVLTAAPKPVLVIFDGVDRYSARALRLAGRYIQAFLNEKGPAQVHILATAQFEAADRLIRRFVKLGIPTVLHTATPIGRPSEQDIQSLIGSVAGLQWASLSPELRPLLTNLKVLDWLVVALADGPAIDSGAVNGLTKLIDVLWERWAEADGSDLSRSGVLMHLGALEAETLSSGVPRMQLEHSEQSALGSLAKAGLVRIRDERVRFSHDLLGDWSRMRVLIAEQSPSSQVNRERANLPRWHRALRLYGQRLLEQSSNGPELWRHAVDEFADKTPAGSVMRDLFLESLFLATNAGALLERSWAALSADGGRLLNRMLNRFLFVATLPDPRIATLIQGEPDAAQWVHLLRVPYWPYWGPMLVVLNSHKSDVARLAPHTAAKVCSLWLRAMPAEISPGTPMPWRQEAAELAVSIGREIQTLNEEGNYYSGGEDKHAYEAVLFAAPEMPEEVIALCLELAARRDLRDEVRQRVEETQRRRREERRQWLAANPARVPAPPPIGSFRGPLREPWPDGPRESVDTAFQEACLDTVAFASLVRARPDAAREVLLAVCIEEPQHDDYSSRSIRECGVSHWRSGDPPLWCRGPFLSFLHQAPDEGVSFVLKLVNFATRQFCGEEGLEISVGSTCRKWFGDSRVFRWHYDWPLLHGSAIHCALMALERWLYEQIDRGDNIDQWLARLMRDSESLAFAGLLFEIGKRVPTLFAGELKPLFQNWTLVDWNRQISTMRQHSSDAMGYWGNQPAAMIELGRQWFSMPHRADPLIYLDSALIREMIGEENHAPFFEQLRQDWTGQLNSQGEPEELRLLIERFNAENYKFELQNGRRVPIDFQWPEAIARKNAEDLRQLGEQTTFTSLPHRCRQTLDRGVPLPQEQVHWLWEFLKKMESNPPQMARDGEQLIHAEDVVCGGIAVLVVLHRDWLDADADRMTWCRRKLASVLENPPTPFRFDSEMASGDSKWDAFLADAGVALLTADRHDALARTLVATSVVSFHYSTTSRGLVRAARSRDQLGDDFDRMLSLAVQWAALRTPLGIATRPPLVSERETWEQRKRTLVMDYVDERLSVALPNINDLNAAVALEIEELQRLQSPELARLRRRRGSSHTGRSREKLYAEGLRLDTRIVSAAFSWLDLQAAQPDEREKWLGFVRMFLDIVLTSLPHIEDARQQEIDGLPSEFDGWVFGVVSAAIPCMTPAENPASLWRPVLDLGTPAHQWVERFFWYWFTDGLRASQSPEGFTTLWGAMIEHALSSALWNPEQNRSYDLDGMVYELLGYDTRMNKLGLDPVFAPAITKLAPIFARAALRWFVRPKVVAGFLNFAVQPAASGLLFPGIKWLAATIPSFDSYDWKYGLEENLIAFLHTCWEREHYRISGDPGQQQAFLSLLSCVVSRGGHPAIALRDRVVGSTAS